jgi:hypothetical protein
MPHNWSAQKRIKILHNRIRYIDIVSDMIEGLQVPATQESIKEEVLVMLGLHQSMLRQEYRIPAHELEREQLRKHPIMEPPLN